MAAKKIAVSHESIIHPGETIAEVLEERGITQTELASRAGVCCAYVCNVISGKKGISANFAMGLEYALGVPKSFWLNLQANYEAELLEFNEERTVTEDEREVRDGLREIVAYLREADLVTEAEDSDGLVLELRKTLQISNIANLKEIVPAGTFCPKRDADVNPHALGAWIRLCQIAGSRRTIAGKFDRKEICELANEIKGLMCLKHVDLVGALRPIMERYGIRFSMLRRFSGVPARGYISQGRDCVYQLVLTETDAEDFWFSLFHEIGHIVNGDVGKAARFIDHGCDCEKEAAADAFAEKMLNGGWICGG